MTFTPPDVTHTFAPTQRSSSSEVNTNYDDIVEQFLLGTYNSNGWRVGTFELVYNSSNSLESATDVDLTSLLEPGMKITFEQATNGEYMGFITHVDYDTTVSNRSYVEVFVYDQTDIVDESLLVDTLGFSRQSLPEGFPTYGTVPLSDFSFTNTGNVASAEMLQFEYVINYPYLEAGFHFVLEAENDGSTMGANLSNLGDLLNIGDIKTLNVNIEYALSSSSAFTDLFDGWTNRYTGTSNVAIRGSGNIEFAVSRARFGDFNDWVAGAYYSFQGTLRFKISN